MSGRGLRLLGTGGRAQCLLGAELGQTGCLRHGSASGWGDLMLFQYKDPVGLHCFAVACIHVGLVTRMHGEVQCVWAELAPHSTASWH